MPEEKLSAASPIEIQSLADGSQTEQLMEALSLVHCWGIHDVEYLPVLEKLLLNDNPELLRLTLGILLNFERGPRENFLRSRNHLPALQSLATTKSSSMNTRFLALELVVKLSGPSQELVPHLKDYLHRFPEEASDLICVFGPLAKNLVPDLITVLDQDDWDTKWAVVDALGAIGPSAHEAVPLLEALTKHESGIITGSACVALERITGKPRTSWPRGPSQTTEQ